MSTTIYDSPEGAPQSVPNQGEFSIDITYATVWFFEHRADDGEVKGFATVPLAQLPAIYDAIGEYLEVVGRDFCLLPRADARARALWGWDGTRAPTGETKETNDVRD